MKVFSLGKFLGLETIDGELKASAVKNQWPLTFDGVSQKEMRARDYCCPDSWTIELPEQASET